MTAAEFSPPSSDDEDIHDYNVGEDPPPIRLYRRYAARTPAEARAYALGDGYRTISDLCERCVAIATNGIASPRLLEVVFGDRGVTRAKIMRRMNAAIHARPGDKRGCPRKLLPEAEQALANHVRDAAVPMDDKTIDELRSRAVLLQTRHGGPPLITAPSRAWVHLFLERNGLRMRSPHAIPPSRLVEQEAVSEWFELVRPALCAQWLDPRFVFNTDETVINLAEGRPLRVATEMSARGQSSLGARRTLST